MPLLRDWNGTNGPLVQRQVRGTIRHLATGYYRVAPGSGSGLAAFSWRDFPLPIPNRQLLRFVVALTACGTEPLTILGKVIVASVQQIAPRALKQPPFELVSC